MKFRFSIYILILSLIITNGCKSFLPGSKQTVTKKKDAYSEDLSTYRPTLAQEDSIHEVPVTDTIYIQDSSTAAVNEKLNYLLDTVNAYTKSNVDYIDGYTIQVYAGNNREMANEFKLDILRHFPECEPQMVFEQPNYKVRIGLFYTRLEAQFQFKQVKEVFSKAILIPTRINIED